MSKKQDYQFTNIKQFTPFKIEQKAKELAFNALFQKLPINFYWMNSEGYLQGCNDQVLQALDLYSIDDFVGKHATEVAGFEAWRNSLLVIRTGKSIVTEEQHVKKDGEVIHYLTIKSPLRNENNKIIGLVGVSVNITEQKCKEEELNKAKKIAEEAEGLKAEFLANMRHDIRTPFSGIYGLAEIMAIEEKHAEKKSNLEAIVQSAKKLLDYCNDMANHQRIESQSLPVTNKAFNLIALLQDIVIMQKPTAILKKLDFNLEVDEAIPSTIKGDDYRLQKVLINLISNALKFTQEGYVKLSVKLLSKDDSHRNIVLRFIVQDTGVGIPSVQQKIIFEKFIRLDPSYRGIYPGQGLGLQVVRQFIEELDGDIYLESTPNKGTKFSFDLCYKLPWHCE